MKILITNVYSVYNAGDAAILNVQIKDLKKVFPKSEITISTMDNPGKIKNLNNSKYVSSFFYQAIYKNKNPIVRVKNFIYVIFASFLWIKINKSTNLKFNYLLTNDLKKIIWSYLESDVVIPVGGGYLSSKNNLKSNISLFLHIYTLYFAKELNKPVYLYPQSIGPISGGLFNRVILSNVLNRMDHLFIRENISMRYLNSIGIDKNKYSRSIDVGFRYKNEYKEMGNSYLRSKNINIHNPILGITARNWLSKNNQRVYEQSIASFIERIIKYSNIQILLVPQVSSIEHNDDDRLVLKRIYGNLKNKQNVTLINDQLNYKLLKNIYSSLWILIGTRMHSCVFSLSSGVPIIAIEYEYKTSGIMSDLGLRKWIVKMEDVSAINLEKKFNELLEERAFYSRSLSKNINEYLKKETIPASKIKTYLNID